jgi:cell division septation protein DedD
MTAAAPEPVAAPARGAQIVQVGSYSSRDTADAARRALEARLGSTGYPLRVRQEGRLFRVIMGPFQSAEQSREVVTRIRSETGIDAFVRPL